MARVNGVLTGTTKATTQPAIPYLPLSLPEPIGEDRAGANVDYVEVPTIGSRTALYAPVTAYGGTSQLVVTTPGTYLWLCPEGITQIYVECFGGGGPGYSDNTGNAGFAGGGGGAFAVRTALAVTPGTLYTFIVGAGGNWIQHASGPDGGDSSFVGDAASCIADGGKHAFGTGGGSGGLASASTGDTTFNGGNGGAGFGQTTTGGAGGGASGNRVGAGAAGNSSVGGSGAGRAGGTGANGGGSGGHGNSSSNAGLTPGSSPGGGGGGGGGAGVAQVGSSGADGEVTISCGVVCPLIGTATQVYTPKLNIPVPFIASGTVVYALALQEDIALPFIASAAVVYTPAIVANVAVPFIASVSAAYAPTLSQPEIDVPFIGSRTRVYALFSLFDPNRTFGGPGNGGETFLVRLAPNGTTVTATLARDITAAARALELTSDGSLPTDTPFVVAIDDEILYIARVAPGSYQIRSRGLSNTPAASHTAGADVAWGDSYDVAIRAGSDIAHSFTADINSTGTFTYDGWLICFDSSQAYLAGDRYPTHVAEVLGVFDSAAGSSGSNRCDGAQPNAVCTPVGASDDCPAALSNPALITSDIAAGDVAVVRYTNPEATVLDLGPRSVALQSWFGLKRVDSTDHDVTLTDPDGYVVDTIPSGPGPGPFTGSVNQVWANPLTPETGIAPDASAAAGAAVQTPNPVPWTTVTLPGTDRYFTYGPPHYDEAGWPMCCLAVRQGRRRVPHWQSWDWHNFNYVYCGFGTDDTFCQLLINRNGIVFGSVPAVDLPGPQDIDGPDAVWDDGSYDFAASWYVVLFGTPYLVLGPSLGGTGGSTIPLGPPGQIPTAVFGPGGPTITFPSGGGTIEGGEGGDIEQPPIGLHVWQTS